MLVEVEQQSYIHIQLRINTNKYVCCRKEAAQCFVSVSS